MFTDTTPPRNEPRTLMAHLDVWQCARLGEGGLYIHVCICTHMYKHKNPGARGSVAPDNASNCWTLLIFIYIYKYTSSRYVAMCALGEKGGYIHMFAYVHTYVYS